MSAHWTDRLIALNACEDAVGWARTYDTPQAAWNACERGDWMLWLLGRLSGPPESASRRELVLIACAVARTALGHVPSHELRPLRAIETAEAWARGEPGISLSDVRTAAYAAAAYAADDAAAAAFAAAAAAYAYAYAYAADAAAAAAAYAAAAYARRTARHASADIVRRMHPQAPELPNGR